jgi:acetylornithine deacetylase/succinyl-diaminopimelate desuccinylase-like protein
MSEYTLLDAYLESNLEASLQELARLVAQPSVAAQNWGLQECASLVAEMLRRRGFRVEVMPTGGAPGGAGRTQGAER